jgi:hypothetical protein
MRKLTVLAGAFAAAMLIAVPVGSAATPQQIYRDYADNGHLDGHYSKSDLQRALKDAVIQGYTPSGGGGANPAVKQKNSGGGGGGGAGGVQGGTATTPPVKSTGGLPFTGLDLALIAIGAMLLLAFGAGLRRFARRAN